MSRYGSGAASSEPYLLFLLSRQTAPCRCTVWSTRCGATNRRLHGLWLTATEALLSADLAAGRSAQVVEEARRFVEENPYRERAWCALMLALYRQGRQAEALAAAQQLRAALSDGLGLDPSPE